MMSLYRNLPDPPIWPYVKVPPPVTFIQITYRYTSGSYLRENTVRVLYKDQSVNAVEGNTQNLL